MYESLERRFLLAKTVFVDANALGASPDGTSWENAFTDLQQGLAAAEASDAIHIANGTYKPSADDQLVSFQLKSGVSLLGGFAGFGAPNPDASDIAAFSSILSGNIGDVALDNDNSEHVVNGSGVDNTAVLNGLTIADGQGSDSGGAGLLLINGAPTVTNCTFTNNDSIFDGGAVLLDDTTVTFMGCTFTNNSSFGSGGGIFAKASSLTLNTCTFVLNVAETAGGGVLIDETSSAVIDGCTFQDSNAFAGGAIDNVGDGSKITNSIFENNAASGGGGAILIAEADSATITNCWFTSNEAGFGGAIYNVSSFPDITNCAFVNNHAGFVPGNGQGGAMYNESSLPVIVNCTFSGNSAGESGGAIHSLSSAPDITNCIFWQDSAPDSPELSDSDGGAVTYNIIQGGFTGDGNIDADPLFVSDPNPSAEDAGDLRLIPGSPAIDSGLNAALPAGIVSDLGGNHRIEDVMGTNDPGAIIDRGAFERPGGGIAGITFNDLDADGVIDAGESPLAGRTVFLDFDGDGTFDPEDVGDSTNAAGEYSFDDGLQAGTYTVRQTLPAGWSQTFPLNGAGLEVTLAPGGGISTGKNFGSRQALGSIAGFVYNDLDGDGVKDANEAGLPVRVVYIDLDNDVVLDANEQSTTTAASGAYALTNLAAGTFKVRQVVPAGWSQTFPLNNFGLNVTLITGQTATGRNFFVRQNQTLGSISGFVYNDLDGDGAKDANESGIAGRTVYIDLDNDVVLDANEKSTTTNASGQYTLTNVGAGTHKVREVVPAGWTQTFPANNFGLNVSLSGGQNATNANFLVRQNSSLGSISGFVYNDLDGDGAKDANESGIAGRTVYIDLDNDSVLDANEKRTTTGASGQYTLASLGAGTYKVRQVRPAGWIQTYPLNNFGLNVTLSIGLNTSGWNFFTKQSSPPGGSVSGNVFKDLDRDQFRDANETGLSGWTAYLDLDNDGVLDTNELRVVTDTGGNYIFSNLAAGTYKIRIVLQAGYVQTTPTNNFGNNATISAGQAAANENFGADN